MTVGRSVKKTRWSVERQRKVQIPFLRSRFIFAKQSYRKYLASVDVKKMKHWVQSDIFDLSNPKPEHTTNESRRDGGRDNRLIRGLSAERRSLLAPCC